MHLRLMQITMDYKAFRKKEKNHTKSSLTTLSKILLSDFIPTKYDIIFSGFVINDLY